jgi:ribosomal protein S18 acetylase RimI-like enzyme
VITYRPFRNTDPPLIVELWNAAFNGQRVIPIQSPILLEYFIFAKPYFDPRGLLLAEEGGKLVGMVHVGFAPSADRRSLDRTTGVIALLGVAPSYRGKGLGRHLLGLGEEYLRQHGATAALAGCMAPDNPFLFGLYGGCNSAGLMSGEEAARPFFERRGYAVGRSCGVFRRSLARLQLFEDPRFEEIRQRYDIIAAPHRQAGWWRECVLGPVETVEYRLQDKQSAEVPARTVLWDMDTFTMHWGLSCVGMIEFTVEPAHRRRGLAKYLMENVFRHLRSRSFHLFEAQADLNCQAALGLLGLFEFQQVEAGHCLRKQLT